MNLVFLHGPAASGKLTTARELERRLGYPVFHNHLVVDLLTTVFTFGSEPFVELRERFWIDVMVRAAQQRRSLIFTFSPEATVRPGFPAKVMDAIGQHGGRVCFVHLMVAADEQLRRVSSESRREFHKISDPAQLLCLQASNSQTAIELELPPVELEIDTTVSSAAHSAETIIDKFVLTREAATDRYPTT